MAQRHEFLASLLGPGWFAGINRISSRPFIAGSALSGLAWTLLIGLGTFYVGPSLISLYDAIGEWGTIAAVVVAITAALLLLARRRLHSDKSGGLGLSPPKSSDILEET